MAMSPACPTADATDGCMTFYYTNQQSARLLFYHDHAWGITRLNVYAGEAAGYLITDPTEQKLFGQWDYSSMDQASRWSSRTAPSFPAPLKWLQQDPTWDYFPLGQRRRPVVPPRLYARPEPRRSYQA